MTEEPANPMTQAIELYGKESKDLAKTVKKLINAQAKLSYEAKRDIIPHAGNIALNRSFVEMVDAIVRITGVPYNLIAAIPTGGKVTPYVMADGWFLACRCDERGILDIDYDVSYDEKNESVLAKCTITMGTGQRFQGVEFKRRQDDSNKNVTFSTIVNKAITQARGKAAYAAVGAPFPGIAEDINDAVSGEVITPAPAKVSISNDDTPKNGGMLVAQARRKWSMNIQEIYQALGIKSLAEITDMGKAWKALHVYVSERDGNTVDGEVVE